ncbi:TPA: AAA family ATPase, partial [Klebsiella variicola subsp. variicola]|nr:AAA family ATPase [Klebsiella variicola subsp. variicola]
GATGAGKTTLLDAICLALYHETPRHCSSWAVMAARSPLITASGWVTGTSRVSTALRRPSLKLTRCTDLALPVSSKLSGNGEPL